MHTRSDSLRVSMEWIPLNHGYTFKDIARTGDKTVLEYYVSEHALTASPTELSVLVPTIAISILCTYSYV